MTFEKVLGLFEDYFEKDKDLEVVKLKHGYILKYWDEEDDNYNELCDGSLHKTPEKLFDALLFQVSEYYTLKDCEEKEIMQNVKVYIDRYNEIAEEKYSVTSTFDDLRLGQHSFDDVFLIFREHFNKDSCLEAVRLKKGYKVMLWDEVQEDYMPYDGILTTPDELFEEVLSGVRSYYKDVNYEDEKIEEIISEYKDRYYNWWL